MASSHFTLSSKSTVVLNSASVSQLRFRFKVSSHLSVVPDSSAVAVEPSNQNTIKISDDTSVAGKNDASELGPVPKSESSPVIDAQPAVTNADRVPKAKKNDKQKKRRLSVTLSKEEIEEDIAAITALCGGKRLRRSKKPNRSRSIADQRRIDRLFPGFEYLGFQ